MTVDPADLVSVKCNFSYPSNLQSSVPHGKLYRLRFRLIDKYPFQADRNNGKSGNSEREPNVMYESDQAHRHHFEYDPRPDPTRILKEGFRPIIQETAGQSGLRAWNGCWCCANEMKQATVDQRELVSAQQGNAALYNYHIIASLNLILMIKLFELLLAWAGYPGSVV